MPVTLRLLGLKLSTRPEGAVVVYVNKSFKCYGVNLFDYLCYYHGTRSNICKRTRYICWMEIKIRLHVKLTGYYALCQLFPLFV